VLFPILIDVLSKNKIVVNCKNDMRTHTFTSVGVTK